MSFSKNFCSSPWFHMRITNNGDYHYCRWAGKEANTQSHTDNIRETDPVNWFKSSMQQIRLDFLSNQTPSGCHRCQLMETHGKVSGRQRQLLKTGVVVEDFEKTMISSPWFKTYQRTLRGETDDLSIQDYQIDLGNYCNSACIFCSPASSSRLATEFKKLDLIQMVPPVSWCDDENILKILLDSFDVSPNLAYLHFIGGETLITPAFNKILSALIDKSLHSKVAIGFTTNLTVWDQNIIDKLTMFREINLGMSIECIHPLNDYVRYPSKIADCISNMQRWVSLAQEKKWLVQLRVTPTALSVWHLDTVYEFALQNGLSVEACNFLDEPAYLRPSVLPTELRQQIIQKMNIWINNHRCDIEQDQIVNTRDPNTVRQQLTEDAVSYVNYLRQQPAEDWRAPDLVRYLKVLESNRNNRVLSYLPEYEQFLRSAGY